MPGTEGKEIDSLKDEAAWGDILDRFEATLALNAAEERLTQLQDMTARRIEEQTRNLLGHWVRTHAPLAQIREIEVLAAAVIGDRQMAFRWLSEPNPATDGKAPIDLLGDESGFDRVKTLLLRIEYGVLA